MTRIDNKASSFQESTKVFHWQKKQSTILAWRYFIFIQTTSTISRRKEELWANCCSTPLIPVFAASIIRDKSVSCIGWAKKVTLVNFSFMSLKGCNSVGEFFFFSVYNYALNPLMDEPLREVDKAFFDDVGTEIFTIASIFSSNGWIPCFW